MEIFVISSYFFINDKAFSDDNTITPLPFILSTIPMSSKSLIALLIVSGDTLYFPAKTERPYNVDPSLTSPECILLAKSSAIF